LDVLCNVWNPVASLLLVDVNPVLDIDFSLVVLGVGSPVLTSLVVADLLNLDNTSFLQVPFDHF